MQLTQSRDGVSLTQLIVKEQEREQRIFQFKVVVSWIVLFAILVFLFSGLSIGDFRQILQHLDLSPPEKPPPDIREGSFACRWTRTGDSSRPNPPEHRSPPPASPHKRSGVRGQASHGDHTRLQGATMTAPSSGRHPRMPGGGVGGGQTPSRTAPAFVGRRFTDLSVLLPSAVDDLADPGFESR